MSPKKQLFDLEVKSQGPTKIIMVRETPPYCHAPTYQISLTYLEKQKSYGPDKLRWEEAEEEAEAAEEEKIRLKTICLPSFEGETWLRIKKYYTVRTDLERFNWGN